MPKYATVFVRIYAAALQSKIWSLLVPCDPPSSLFVTRNFVLLRRSHFPLGALRDGGILVDEDAIGVPLDILHYAHWWSRSRLNHLERHPIKQFYRHIFTRLYT